MSLKITSRFFSGISLYFLLGCFASVSRLNGYLQCYLIAQLERGWLLVSADCGTDALQSSR